MDKQFTPDFRQPEKMNDTAWWFAFRGRRMLVNSNGSRHRLPEVRNLEQLGIKILATHYMGQYGDHQCVAADLPEHEDPPQGMEFVPLRSLFGHLPDTVFVLCGRAIQLIEWDQTSRFCGRCGTETRPSSTERVRECPACGLTAFPRVAPAIIVLVQRGDELLLARSPRFPSEMYSVLAGFVEPGETLEEAVAREIQEEVGIAVKNIRYFGSQPWPFPHSLMVGFIADYAHGDIRVDNVEIEAAGWYKVNDLPLLPSQISISRQLIDWFIHSHRKGSRDEAS